MQVTQGLRRAAEMRGDAAAVLDGEAVFGWRELQARVARLAGALLALGLEPGDRVALLAENAHRTVEFYYASIWAGGVMVPLNTRLAGPELRALVEDCAPRILIFGADFAGSAADLAELVPVLVPIQPGHALSYEALIEAAPPAPPSPRAGHDLAAIVYTGGTTGRGKGVMLSHANIVANSLNVISYLGLDETSVHLHCGPLFHIGAGQRVFSVTQAAGTHVMLPRFTAEGVLAAIERNRITICQFVPTMVRMILDLPDRQRFDVSSLRMASYGAAPMPVALLREWMAAWPHCQFSQAYGQTECAPVATTLLPRYHQPGPHGPARLDTVGRATLTAEVRIRGEDGRPAAPGAIGEIEVKGPMVMLGYWRQPELTAATLIDGWLRTGDIGAMEEDGFLRVLDRAKDMIVSGGENVYSVEVENVLAAHPDIAECAVIGVPDALWGERVHAAVVVRGDATLELKAVQDFCRGALAGYKIPRSIGVWPTPLPRSPANKIDKRALRRAVLAGETSA